MKMKKIAFTLIELIVVVTILAILSTVAFVSYSHYIVDSRNSKRTSDITNIVQKIELELIGGGDLFSFVSNSGSRITNNIKISGRIGTGITIKDYNAGDINNTALGLNDNIVMDPSGVSKYKIGVVNINNGPFYEVAGTMEKNGGLDAYVKGTWYPRKQIKFYRDGGPSHTNIYTIVKSDNFNLTIGDIVQINTGRYEILNIKNDEEIYLNKTINPTGSKIFLPNSESIHLIKKWSSSDYPIQEGKGRSFVPYLLK